MSAFVTAHAVGTFPTSPLKSIAVKTPITPGTARAFVASIRTSRACAYGLRTNFAYTVPGGVMSATYEPRPMRKRSSSFRRIRSPITCAIGSLPSRHHLGCGRDAPHDVHVARAAAQVPRDPRADLFFRRRFRHLQEFRCREDHAGRAEAALEPVVLLERLLDRVQPSVLREPFDRRDRRAVRLDHEHRARLHGPSVEEDRARAAVARVAPHVGAREPELVPNEVHEEGARFDGPLVPRAVHGQSDAPPALRRGGLRVARHAPRPPARSPARPSAPRAKTSTLPRL